MDRGTTSLADAGTTEDVDVGEGASGDTGERGGRRESEERSESREETGGSGDSNALGYQTRIPGIPQGACTLAVDGESAEGVGIYGDGQGPPTAMVMGDWKNGHAVVRM